MAIEKVSKEEVTLSVSGNVPTTFEDGTVTHLTFGASQAWEVFNNLRRVFNEATLDGFGTSKGAE